MKNYINSKTQKNEIFLCDKQALSSGLCIFHDESYLNDSSHHKEVRESFLEMLKIANQQNKSLICMGYNLPDIRISDKYGISVHIIESVFHGSVNFDNCEFEDNVQFTRSKFMCEASFTGSIFKKESDFSHVEFNGSHTTFIQTKFERPVTFTDSHFQKASFNLSKFHEVNFSSSIFNGLAEFWQADFNERTNFNKCIFNDRTDFSLSTFSKSTNFENVDFLGYMIFRKTRISNDAQIFFDGDLSNTTFLETDISRIKFGNHVIWNKRSVDINSFWMGLRNRNDQFKILDERILEIDEESDLQIESVMDVYRNLRDNFEYHSRYDVSGEFFVREMELKRKYKTILKDDQIKTIKRNPLSPLNFILGTYNLMAQYGQSYYRPLFMAIPLLVLSTLYFWTGRFSHMDVLTNLSLQSGFNNAAVRSLSAFFPFYTFDKYQALSDFILRIILLPISGTFFVALKRKLERQLRY